jgi:lipopolysaccharide assembly protein A
MATQQPVNQPADHSPAAAPPAAEVGVTGPTVKTPRSRAGAVWVGICIAALLLIVLVIFMLQNTRPVLVTFFSLEGTVPLAIALLIAGVGVGLIALVVGTVRIAQLRRRLSRSDLADSPVAALGKRPVRQTGDPTALRGHAGPVRPDQARGRTRDAPDVCRDGRGLHPVLAQGKGRLTRRGGADPAFCHGCGREDIRLDVTFDRRGNPDARALHGTSAPYWF